MIIFNLYLGYIFPSISLPHNRIKTLFIKPHCSIMILTKYFWSIFSCRLFFNQVIQKKSSVNIINSARQQASPNGRQWTLFLLEIGIWKVSFKKYNTRFHHLQRRRCFIKSASYKIRSNDEEHHLRLSRLWFRSNSNVSCVVSSFW